MKLKYLCVFLVIGFMASVAFGAEDQAFYWDGSDNDWSDGGPPDHSSSNWLDNVAGPRLQPDGSQEVKIFGGTNKATPLGGTVTVNTVEQWVTIATNRMRIYGGATMNIVEGGALIGPGWLRVGEGSAGGASTINQTGGTLKLIGSVAAGGRDPTRLMMGDSQDTIGSTSGLYRIEGGTLTFGKLVPGSTAEAASEGRIVLGDRGGTGAFKVVGTGGTIDMGLIMVGGNYMSGAYRVGTGTVEYELKGGSAYNVSPIQINPTTASIAACNGGAVVDIGGSTGLANLIVTAAGAPVDDILLVKQAGTTAVHGFFDTLNGVAGAAREGTTTYVGGRWYRLTYEYNAEANGGLGARTGGNDIALIPEPATLALLSIGLFAIRRKK